MHEGLATQDAKKTVAMLFGIRDEIMEVLTAEHLSRRFHIDPASLAAQIAAIQDGDIKKRRQILAVLQPAFEFLDREHPLPAEIPGELPNQALIRAAQDPYGQSWEHFSVWELATKSA